MKKILIFSILALMLAACGKSSTGYNSYEESNTGNPYNSDSGHGAGYDWAERTGGNCTGNSQSFNEGCEEYYRQMEQ